MSCSKCVCCCRRWDPYSPRCCLVSIGLLLLTILISLLSLYLVFIEGWRSILYDYFGIETCSSPALESVTDTCLEYAVITCFLIVIGANKWFLLPWLIVFGVIFIVLVTFSLAFCWSFVASMATSSAHYIGLVISVLSAFVINVIWMYIYSVFRKLDYTVAGPIAFRVQVATGIWAFIQTVILAVMYYFNMGNIDLFAAKYGNQGSDYAISKVHYIQVLCVV